MKSRLFSNDKLGLTGIEYTVGPDIARPKSVLAEESEENRRIHLDKEQQKDRWASQNSSWSRRHKKNRES